MEEKMAILKMLEEGKISPEQAAELIKAVGASADAAGPTPGPDPRANSRRTAHTPPPSHGGSGHTHRTPDDSPRQNYSGGRPPGEHKGLGLDEFAMEMRDRFGELAKEWEPKLKSFAGQVAEKTADLAERVAKATETKPSSHSSGGGFSSEPRSSVSHGASGAFGATVERTFELGVGGVSNELVLAGQNAPVTIKGYNGDKISAKISYRPRRPDADVSLVSHGNKYILNYDDTAIHALAIDAYVPEGLFRTVRVSTNNAPLHVSNIRANSFTASSTDNKIDLQNIVSDMGVIDATNGIISASDLDIENMKLETSNAPINLNMSNYAKFSEYTWQVETSNGRIFANVPSTPDLGYHIKAASALGSVKLGLTGLSYIQNLGANIEARSVNYDACAKRVRISFESSNAEIIVN